MPEAALVFRLKLPQHCHLDRRRVFCAVVERPLHLVRACTTAYAHEGHLQTSPSWRESRSCFSFCHSRRPGSPTSVFCSMGWSESASVLTPRNHSTMARTGRAGFSTLPITTKPKTHTS